MKFMQVYSNIFEFNSSDKIFIQEIGHIFTISLEIELETSDKNNPYSISLDKFLEIIKKSTNEFITEKDKDIGLYGEKVNDILSELDLEEDYDDDHNQEIFEEYIKIASGKFEKDLYRVIYAEYLTYWCSDNVEYLTEQVENHLPNFYKKWSNFLKFELDNTLERGIEFSPKKYLEGIEQTIEYIDDFYNDFKNQEYWYMSKATGLHINIGLKEKKDWNILKGMLMISDEGIDSFIFKDMQWRQESMYSKSFLPQLKKDIESNKEKILKHSQFQDISKLEKYFSEYILKRLQKHGYKNYGFNITRIKEMNYVEFRYPGGDINKDLLINKLYYFCYIVQLMTERNFKRKKYLNKLYKFISNL